MLPFKNTIFKTKKCPVSKNLEVKIKILNTQNFNSLRIATF